MVKYYFEKDKFVIEDFLNAKTFSSFLPAIAGIDGKPMWAFYANVGQCMGGFGVSNRKTPITPFDSATLAYQNIPLKGFRTFLKINNILHVPFKKPVDFQKMIIEKTQFSIVETTSLYSIKITYSTLAEQPYAALVRKVEITNPSSSAITYDMVDGLPIFLPYGLSNIDYKELVSLMAAYCQVHNLEKGPFIKFKTSTGDNSVVKENEQGNGFYGFKVINGKPVVTHPIVDLEAVFGVDKTLLRPLNFVEMDYCDFVKIEQQTENKIPSAFTSDSFTLKPNESLTFYTLYGSFRNIEEFDQYIVSNTNLLKIIENDNTQKIVDDIVSCAAVHTSSPIFDEYIKQTYLDNGLRGGFPLLIKNQPYYVFSRKHGDMERDYNFFDIPSKYYSSGSGNFRDVNQNRRSDLYYAPYLKDYNINIFFNLIQADGQNPLTVKPNHFHINSQFDYSQLFGIENNKALIELIQDYEPSDLYMYLKDQNRLDLFEMIIENSTQSVEAMFSEGYWIDHWTYNVDLLENYEGIYPDKLEELLFAKKYKYFYSPVFVEPRSEKYCLINEHEVRQYGAIDLKKVKRECEKRHIDISKTDWLKDKNGQIIETTLASKILNLIVIKFSTLDSEQMGIEMECEKPGWNDAMNGLPGLFASGMSETIELLRLIRFLRRNLTMFKDHKIEVLKEQAKLFQGVNRMLRLFNQDLVSSFEYWDAVTTMRENFREQIKYFASNTYKTISVRYILSFLKVADRLLEHGIMKAKEVGQGIIPSYIIYRPKSFVKLNHINQLGYETVRVTSFELETIPPFLEASARMFKLGKKIAKLNDYRLIKQSDLYDKTLKIYKTSAALDDAPFEIGRVHAFTKGWLERECNFLHMSYKYLLGLLKAGYYQEFYKECQTNLVCNMGPYVYGRSTIENSSFIVPTCNPDKKNHGRGFFARLTGANAEMINMVNIMFIGEKPFSFVDGVLHFELNPKLPASFFDENNECSCMLFASTKIVYHNPYRLDCFKKRHLQYKVDGVTYESIVGQLAEDIRANKVKQIDVEIK